MNSTSRIQQEPFKSIESDTYDPNSLLDALLRKMQVRDDAALARALKIDAKILGKLRERRLQVSACMLILMQEATGIGIATLRTLLKDRRKTLRMTYGIDYCRQAVRNGPDQQNPVTTASPQCVLRRGRDDKEQQYG
jgi:hypothetical protein